MSSRTDKIKLLDSILNQGNKDSLQSLSRSIYPNVLIYQERLEGLLFSGKLNATLPARYQDKVLNDKQLNAMLIAGGNGTAFLLPDNGRDN